MAAPYHFSCRLCRTTYVAHKTICPACTDADTYTLTVRVRHLLGLRRNIDEARGRIHAAQSIAQAVA